MAMASKRKRRASSSKFGFAAALLTVALLSPFAVLAYLGFFYPPAPLSSSAQPVKELPWRSLDAHGIARTQCTGPRIHTGRHQHFLAAVIFNRVFSQDYFGIRSYECSQWVEYMLYAGVEHIYWYDTAHSNAESQMPYLAGYIQTGLLTYHRFHHLFPGMLAQGFHYEQDTSYAHFLQTYGSKAKWVVQMDVDEYPFCPSDHHSCFLRRFVADYESQVLNLTQILLQCMIFAGNPRGDLVNGWVIEKYQRRKYETEGVATGYLSRQKPIFRADACKGGIRNNPHVVNMGDGLTLVVDEKRIRMNHYWGARESGYGPDGIEDQQILVPDSSIQPIASQIKRATQLIRREDDKLGALLRWMARA